MDEVKNAVAARWRITAFACVATFVVLLVIFYTTGRGMVYVWYNFETYTHGFLILPITLWLIWQKRAHLAAYTPQPSAFFILPVIGGLFVWSLARLTGVLVVEQLAFVGILVSAMAGLLGWQVSRFLVFPLLFLFFAVPMGEDLTPPMMEFTATFTVEALKLTGIPVYRDGLWFSLPSGNWSVVEACSGVRYLIASVTLGVMYAYITYHTLWKRLLFIALSAIVPILANGVRAYMIVMIGHLSEMKYATGVDHLIYGWFFFGVVMFILFWIGSYWHEEHEAPTFVAPARAMSTQSVNRQVLWIALLTIVVSAVTVWGTQRAASVEQPLVEPLGAPAGQATWSRSPGSVAWSAEHQPTPHKIEALYSDGKRDVQLYVVLFSTQRQGGEAINQDNRIAVDLVKETRLGQRTVKAAGVEFPILLSKAIIRVAGENREYLVGQWYRVAGRSLINRYEGKAWEALARLYPGRSDGAWIAVATPIEGEDRQSAERQLADFVSNMATAVDERIDRALGIVD